METWYRPFKTETMLNILPKLFLIQSHFDLVETDPTGPDKTDQLTWCSDRGRWPQSHRTVPPSGPEGSCRWPRSDLPPCRLQLRTHYKRGTRPEPPGPGQTLQLTLFRKQRFTTGHQIKSEFRQTLLKFWGKRKKLVWCQNCKEKCWILILISY